MTISVVPASSCNVLHRACLCTQCRQARYGTSPEASSCSEALALATGSRINNGRCKDWARPISHISWTCIATKPLWCIASLSSPALYPARLVACLSATVMDVLSVFSPPSICSIPSSSCQPLPQTAPPSNLERPTLTPSSLHSILHSLIGAIASSSFSPTLACSFEVLVSATGHARHPNALVGDLTAHGETQTPDRPSVPG
jgi:hypothetical protein